MVKLVVALCPCPKSLSEGKVKRLRSIALTKEVFKTTSIDFVLWFTMIRTMRTKQCKLIKKIQILWLKQNKTKQNKTKQNKKKKTPKFKHLTQPSKSV